MGEIAALCGGKYTGSDKNAAITGISTDSRSIGTGELFIPIVGERFDGHDYIQQAFELGAKAALSARSGDDGRIIYVGDTMEAMQRIARGYRDSLEVKVTAVTGSVGKTTTKEMIAAVLSEKYETHKNKGNLNNTIGVPLSVFGLEKRHRAAVFEMGMNRFGEISAETRVAGPDVAVILNIGTAHIEFLGSREGILKAKLEITEGLSAGGTLILNGDEPLLWNLKGSAGFKTLYFGCENIKCDFFASDIKQNDFESEYDVRIDGEPYHVRLPSLGIHSVMNSLAAIAVGREYGMEPEEIIRGLNSFENAEMRQNIYIKDGFKIIDDCYNANPESMLASLNVLSEINTRGRRIAVLGDMLELGDRAYDEHFALGERAEMRCDAVFLYGENMKAFIDGSKGKSRLFETREELAKTLKGYAQPGDVILFKGSRGMRIEEVRKLFLEEND